MMTAIQKQDLIQRIDKALDEVRPHLAIDGGNIKVVDVSEDMIVHVEWMGNCENCSMSELTMRAGVEETLKNKIPEISSVKAVN